MTQVTQPGLKKLLVEKERHAKTEFLVTYHHRQEKEKEI